MREGTPARAALAQASETNTPQGAVASKPEAAREPEGSTRPAKRSRACERNQRVVVCLCCNRRGAPVGDADDKSVRSAAQLSA